MARKYQELVWGRVVSLKAVDHPPHYSSTPAKCSCGKTIECIAVARHMNFNRGNALKYIWRAGLKDDETQDLMKAIWYLDDEIKRIERLKSLAGGAT